MVIVRDRCDNMFISRSIKFQSHSVVLFRMSFPMMISMSRSLITSTIMPECVLLFKVTLTIASPIFFASWLESAKAIIFFLGMMN